MRTVLIDTDVLIGLVDRTDSLHERAVIWTYDSEFKAIWRTPGGKKPSLVA